jgi:hypothetical protein
MHTPKWKLFAALWTLTIVCRLFPYVLHRMTGFDVTTVTTGFPWNFSPLYAVSLFGGAYLSSRLLACAWPVVAYAAVNLGILLLTDQMEWASKPEIWFNYLMFALFPVFGFGLDRKEGSPLIPALWRGFSASLAFFVASNFAAFLVSYPKSVSGLIDCYYQALPFYGPTLASTLLFTLVLFSPIGVRATQPVPVYENR